LKIGTRKYERAMFLRERALEMIHRHGIVVVVRDRGFGRQARYDGFSVWYTDPETAECDEYHHLDVHAENCGKVSNVRWKDNQAPEVVTFKRGSWEEYSLS
jgi:hypothetical protein